MEVFRKRGRYHVKILFVCAGGMSSAILIQALKNEAKKEGHHIEALAIGTFQLEGEITKGWDVVMVAPQVKHRLDSIKQVTASQQVPCDVIPLHAYTPLGGPVLWEKAKELLTRCEYSEGRRD
jgi:cellobiose PTS system EIIB component